MKTKLAIVFVSLGLLLALLGVKESRDLIVGGVAPGDTYLQATTTGSFANATSTMLRIGTGEIGSVVIGVTSGTTFIIKDANHASDSASTTILSVAASPAIGSTMLLDYNFKRGLFIDFPASFVGRYTVTYR